MDATNTCGDRVVNDANGRPYPLQMIDRFQTYYSQTGATGQQKYSDYCDSQSRDPRKRHGPQYMVDLDGMSMLKLVKTTRAATLRYLVLIFWLLTVGCWIIEEFVCYTLKFAYFSSKQTDLSSIQDNLVQNLKFLTDNRPDSYKSSVLIWSINTPLFARQW